MYKEACSAMKITRLAARSLAALIAASQIYALYAPEEEGGEAA